VSKAILELPQIIEALSRPEAYPERPPAVQVIETHISVVFLLGQHVYKIKKPVDLGFLDFSTLEKRKFYCHEEVRLNRRLSPDVYFGVVPISRRDGSLAVGGQGEVVEYAVKMRQLPADRIMDRLLEQDKITPEMMERLAAKIAAFHQAAETSPEIAQFGSKEINLKNCQENFDQTKKYLGAALPESDFEKIKAFSYRFVEENSPLFDKRMRQDRVRDCHGDLHTQHVCFADNIYVFDCIEFNDRFRFSDVAREVAFLAMDLDFHGRQDLAKHFIDSYEKVTGDIEMGCLLAFYKSYLAYVRGKVTAFRLDEPRLAKDEAQRLKEVARRYFDLALSYAN